MKANSLNTLCLVGDRYKYTAILAIIRGVNLKLFAALACYPFYAFSHKGRRNVCTRFKLTNAELEATLLVYERSSEPNEIKRQAANLSHLLQVIERGMPYAQHCNNINKRKGGGKW